MAANILVVDDDELVRWSVCDCLEREGHKVTAVGNAAEARERRAEGSHDLVLLDFMIPDTDGLELLREWHSDAPELPVVMMTAHSSVEHAVEVMRCGATDYLSKPCWVKVPSWVKSLTFHRLYHPPDTGAISRSSTGSSPLLLGEDPLRSPP